MCFFGIILAQKLCAATKTSVLVMSRLFRAFVLRSPLQEPFRFQNTRYFGYPNSSYSVNPKPQ